LPKLMVAGLAPSDPTARPDPVSGMLRVATLLVKAIFPLTFPLAAGVKVAVKAALWPGDKVRGRVMPPMANPAPVALACETVTLVPPELVMVPFWLCVLPTVTLPKLRLAGEAVRAPGLTPEPVRARDRFEFEVLIVIVPVTVPAATGVKVTSKDALCPGASVFGRASPPRANPAPVAVTWLMVALLAPELVTTAVRFWLVCTGTLPKLRLVGESVSCPAVVPLPVADKIALVGDDDCPTTPFVVREAAPLKETLAFCRPAVFGAKVTVKVVFWPGERVVGSAKPLIENTALLVEA